MRLFIAEKPELARAIAEAISGNAQKHNGYITKGDCTISWAFGHILELAEPESYNEKYKKWNLCDLPINLPAKLKKSPIPRSKDQLKILVSLIAKASEIIHCGDADEEGQILIDEILEYAKTTKPVFRCLINDITPKAIERAIAQIRPNSDFYTLSQSGFARSEADFLVGLNLTRLYTLLNQKNGGNGLVSVGRVQSPILGLIVNRELDFKNHKSQEYFNIQGNFGFGGFSIVAPLKVESRILQESEALRIKGLCEGRTAAFTIKKESKKEHPPLPYNLLNLQADASKLYGLSPDKVLEITQVLREKHKAISYNRSDCEYLPENLFGESGAIIECLKENLGGDFGQFEANTSIKSRAWDDSKLSAHYAIMPLQTKLSSPLSENERRIYELICKRFLLQFYEPCLYESYALRFQIDDCIFETTKRKNTSLGFKARLGKDESSDDGSNGGNGRTDDETRDNLESLMNLSSSSCQAITIKKEKTKPLPLYTMTTLLKDLNQVSKYVKDPKIKKLLLEKDKDKKGESGGIGTPATRSNHIKTLIEREYIVVSKDKKQEIKTTQKGFKLIESLHPLLSAPDMTALWFEKQKEILNGTLTKEAFIAEINEFVKSIINENKESKMSVNDEKNGEKCPKCNDGFLRKVNGKYGEFFSCSNYQNGCDFKAKSKNGKPDLSPKAAQETTRHKCPKCGNALVRRESKKQSGNYWYGCSSWRDGCDFTCFEKNGEPNLEKKN